MKLQNILGSDMVDMNQLRTDEPDKIGFQRSICIEDLSTGTGDDFLQKSSYPTTTGVWRVLRLELRVNVFEDIMDVLRTSLAKCRMRHWRKGPYLVARVLHEYLLRLRSLTTIKAGADTVKIYIQTTTSMMSSCDEPIACYYEFQEDDALHDEIYSSAVQLENTGVNRRRGSKLCSIILHFF